MSSTFHIREQHPGSPAFQDAAAANPGAVVVLQDLLENGVVIRRISSQAGLLERGETLPEDGCLSCTVRLDLVPIDRLLERGETHAGRKKVPGAQMIRRRAAPL